MAATISTAAPSSVISSKTARTRSANTKSRVVTPQKRNQGLINKQQARHFVKWGTSVLNTIDDGGVESEIDESEIYQSEDTEREDDKSGSVLHSRAVQLLEDIHPGKEKFAESSCELGNILTDPQFPSKYHGTEKASVLKVATEVLGGCKASAKESVFLTWSG